jgi:hypothetical protein
MKKNTWFEVQPGDILIMLRLGYFGVNMVAKQVNAALLY